MMKPTEIEVKDATIDQRTALRNAGFSVYKLDHFYYNVTCEESRVDDLTDMLEELGLEWRLV